MFQNIIQVCNQFVGPYFINLLGKILFAKVRVFLKNHYFNTPCSVFSLIFFRSLTIETVFYDRKSYTRAVYLTRNRVM